MGQRKRKISHFYTLVDLYMKEHTGASRVEKQHNNEISSLYRLDFEVQGDQGENKALEEGRDVRQYFIQQTRA